MNLLKAIGLSAALKGFIIFISYGFITTIYIHFRHGLDADLPESVIATLEGPLSIYTFGWLALVGIISLFITTGFGAKECDFVSKKPKLVFYFSLPICEAAMALGVVIGATLLGIAIASNFLYFIGSTQIEIYPVYYALSVFAFFVTFPVAYFSLSLLDAGKKIKNKLDFAGFSFFIISIAFLYVNLPIANFAFIGIGVSVLILLFKVAQGFKAKK